MTDIVNKTAAELVSEFRDAVGGVWGWQTALAHAMGVSRSYVCKLASGANSGARLPYYRMGRLLEAVRDPQSVLQTAAPAAHRRLAVSLVAAKPPSREPDPQDPEFAAMQTLAAIDDSVRRRVLAWAASRWSGQ